MKAIKFVKGLSKTQITSYILFMVSGLILLATIYMNIKVDVLKDWRLVLPQQEIRIGDTIVVQSLYTKTMNVTGESIRYIECKTSNGVYIRYPVSEAKANRAAGTSGTGVPIVVPETIPNVPTRCRINITIDYEIYLLRHVVESANSDEFELLPKKTTSEDESQKTSQSPVSVSQIVDRMDVSSSNNTAVPQYAQRDISQGQDNIVESERTLDGNPEEPTPNLIQRITNLLGGR